MIRLLVASLSLCFAGSASAAFIVIDDFANPTPSTFFLQNSVGTLNLAPQLALIGTRNASVTLDVASGSNAMSGNVGYVAGFNDGVFDFNTNTFSRGSASLNYNTFAGGSLNLDYNGNLQFLRLDFRFIDAGNSATNIPLDVAISTTNGGLYSGSFLLASSPGPVTHLIPFNLLTGLGDLSQVMSINYRLNGGVNQRQASDFQLTAIGLEVIPVPAPATVFLGLLAIPVLRRLRR